MLTVICPVLNEENHIQKVIDFFNSSIPLEKELIIIDGGSKDGTIKIIRKEIEQYRNIHLLINNHKYVPFALNLAIRTSKGDPIVRLDAHTEYENDYFEMILLTFKDTNADIVGGPMNAVGHTIFQKSVAYATSCKFGVGDSKIHQKDFVGETDHVYLGAWRRKIFDEVGYFDERFIRNQDDEFHYRAKSLGKKIYLNPAIKSYYYPRNSWWKLFAQYFQYGLYKPLVSKKVKSEIKLRHLIPSVFTIYLVLILLFREIPIVYLPLTIYIILTMMMSIINSESVKSKLLLLIVFPTIHIAYGIGYILGLYRILSTKFK